MALVQMKTLAKSELGTVCSDGRTVAVSSNRRRRVRLGAAWQTMGDGFSVLETRSEREYQAALWAALDAITRSGLGHYVVTTAAPAWMQQMPLPHYMAVYHDDHDMRDLLQFWGEAAADGSDELAVIAAVALVRSQKIQEIEELVQNPPEIERLMSFQ